MVINNEDLKGATRPQIYRMCYQCLLLHVAESESKGDECVPAGFEPRQPNALTTEPPLLTPSIRSTNRITPPKQSVGI